MVKILPIRAYRDISQRRRHRALRDTLHHRGWWWGELLQSHHLIILISIRSYTELLIVLVFLWPPWTEARSEVSESHEESPEDSLDTTLGFDLSTTFTSLVPSIQG